MAPGERNYINTNVDKLLTESIILPTTWNYRKTRVEK